MQEFPPRTSTGDLLDKFRRWQPRVTSAMLRTWPVRLLAIRVHALGQVLPDPRHLREPALAPSLPSFHLRAHRVTSEVKHAELLDIVLTMWADLQELAHNGRTVDIQLTVCARSPWATAERPGHFTRRPQQVVNQRLTEPFHVPPMNAGKVGT